MVHANEYHSIPQQGGSVQVEAGKITFEQLLSGLLWWKRCQPSSQISAMEIQPGQSSTLESLSSVSIYPALNYNFLTFCSLTQATDTSNIRLVFAAVKETILQNALKDSGIL
jgi:hypothetical protein